MKCVDGPCAGAELVLRRAPIYLRVVVAVDGGKIDALDQLADTPSDGETIYVYRQVEGTFSAAFLDYRGKDRHLSGRYEFADYRYVPDAPTAGLRDTAAWRDWVLAQSMRAPL